MVISATRLTGIRPPSLPVVSTGIKILFSLRLGYLRFIVFS